MMLESFLRRDRLTEAAGLTAVTLLAWAYMFAGAGMSMGEETTGAMMTRAAWTPAYAAVIFAMWWIMMVAMMLPSASPTILLFAKISRKQREAGKPFAPASAFTLGYLLVWGLFSTAAAGLQWGLERSGLLSMMMESTSLFLSGVILIAAGLWQLTPLKLACLRHCRSPLHFVTHGFRPGLQGAVRMGMAHGLYCLGCCWFLMLLLFYGGVMNLYWILGLAVYVLIEKIAPAGEWVSRLAGLALLVWGGWTLSGQWS